MNKKMQESEVRLKLEKQKQRDIKRFLRKARVPKQTTYEEIQACILHYVRRMKRDFWKVALPDSLRNDPKFLLELYNANLEMTRLQRPSFYNEEIQNNVNFMIEFLKLSTKRAIKGREQDSPQYQNDHIQMELMSILRNYKTSMGNPKFVEKLAQEFSYVNIVKVIDASIRGCGSLVITHEDALKREEKAKIMLSVLPNELLCNQARTFGYEALTLIPNEIPDFNKVVSAGIEKDGFKALLCLDIEQVLDNKPLVIKAYQKGGVEELAFYINKNMSPTRTRSYMCHDEDHVYFEYDERYAKVQKALLEDEEIKAIFEKEKQKTAKAAQAVSELKTDAKPDLTR